MLKPFWLVARNPLPEKGGLADGGVPPSLREGSIGRRRFVSRTSFFPTTSNSILLHEHFGRVGSVLAQAGSSPTPSTPSQVKSLRNSQAS